MSQHDFDIANATASNARVDVNLALKALGSLSSGTTEPTTRYANMLWYHTGTNLLKIRNEANDAWINIGYVDQAGAVFSILNNTKTVATDGSDRGLLGPQLDAAWETGTSTTESLVSPAKVKAAVIANSTSTAPTMQVFTASGTWTKPSGCKSVKITVTGGGQGGGNSSTGGANAATGISTLDVTSIATATITRGAGSAGNSSGDFGSAGGASVWSDGTNTVTANGGTISGATVTGSQISVRGGSKTTTGSTEGSASYWGSGGAGFGSGSGVGSAGLAYGSGGGGGSAGGAGADGVITVEEFY